VHAPAMIHDRRLQKEGVASCAGTGCPDDVPTQSATLLYAATLFLNTAASTPSRAHAPSRGDRGTRRRNSVLPRSFSGQILEPEPRGAWLHGAGKVTPTPRARATGAGSGLWRLATTCRIFAARSPCLDHALVWFRLDRTRAGLTSLRDCRPLGEGKQSGDVSRNRSESLGAPGANPVGWTSPS